MRKSIIALLLAALLPLLCAACAMTLSPLRETERPPDAQRKNCEWVVGKTKGESDRLFMCCQLGDALHPSCMETTWQDAPPLPMRLKRYVPR